MIYFLKRFHFLKRKISFLIKSIFIALRYKRSPLPLPPHYLSIVAILKNEGNYIAEWIEYHLLVGVTKFFLYDNGSDDNIKEVLAPYIKEGIVEYKYYPGNAKQFSAYKDVLKKAREETFWLAIIDIDEFIVPISKTTISEFLRDFEKFPGMEINWVVYGSNGKKEKENGLVIERFKAHSLIEFESNRNVKTILNPRSVVNINIHASEYIFWRNGVNSNKEKVKCFFSERDKVFPFLKRDGVFDKIVVNHYFTKSYEEYVLRRSLGKATDNNVKYGMEAFYKYDKNDIKNDPIMDKYIPLVYENLKLRSNCFRTNSERYV